MYFKVFNNEEEYNAFKNGDNFIKPSVSVINKNKMVVETVPKFLLYDVVYYDSNSRNIKVLPYRAWKSTIGTPIGLVVIPSDTLPDGRARIVSLYPVTSAGTAHTSTANIPAMYWSQVKEKVTSITSYTKLSGTNNLLEDKEINYGFLPSDVYDSGVTSYVDPKAKYAPNKTNFIYSPYYMNNYTINKKYYKSNFHNALQDFKGYENTNILAGLGVDYIAARAAWGYKDVSRKIQWYLPTVGELGFVFARIKKISQIITALGGVSFENGIGRTLTSSQRDANSFWCIDFNGGSVNGLEKNGGNAYLCRLYPFAKI